MKERKGVVFMKHPVHVHVRRVLKVCFMFASSCKRGITDM